MTESDVILFSVVVLTAFVLLIVAAWVGHWISSQPPSLCPYTGKPLRHCSDLSYFVKEQVLRYLFFLRQYDNRIFDLERAAFCRTTGRIFPDARTWYGVLRVDWNFLKKRYPGEWVSWGSLTEAQQEAVREAHHKLEGYQMEYSCPEASPKQVTPEYALAIPGPLYVDLETKNLLGWKAVPDTEFEVLILTKPRGIFEPPKR